MYIKEFIYNTPKTEYKFDGNGKLIEAVPTGLSGISKINILYAEKGNVLVRKETGEILGDNISFQDGDSMNNYEEVSGGQNE